MKYLFFVVAIVWYSHKASAQVPKIELYNLIKALLIDSSGYGQMGDWAVNKPKKFPVLWDADRIEMSDDTSINFFRKGKVSILKNKMPWPAENANQWNIMLKGPRMGYASFSMISPAVSKVAPRLTLDSLFRGKPYKATLLKACDDKPVMGYYFYEVKIPKKDVVYLKISWIVANGKTAYRIDGYDGWSRQTARLDCR